MSAAFQNLLEETAQFPGLRAAGVFGQRIPSLSRVSDERTSGAEIEKVWRHLLDGMEVAQHHRMPAVQMRWIFDSALVYCLRRSDGRLLGMIFSREAAALDLEQIEHVFERFRNVRET